ncbi:MAG: signal peptidase I [Clostridiales bacterium 43-6]|nr:MAG: signal peptidase I [Clostridiales bacterium 43-6]
MKSSISKIASVVVKVLLCVIIVVTSVFVFITLSRKDGLPNVLGYSILSVQSDSMKGDKAENFQKGDLIYVKSADFTKLEVGQIVTFRTVIKAEGDLNTHRIIAIDKSGTVIRYQTKGDNVSEPDEGSISPGDIVGVYKGQIKGMGAVMDFLGSPLGFFFCMVLPLLIFFIWRLVKLILAVIDYKKANDKVTIDKTEKETESIEAEASQDKDQPAE